MAALPGTACRRRIYLMRHGEVVYFDADGRPLDPRHVPLTSTGQRQARAAADFLAEVEFDHALCSGLRRTLETAQIVLGPHAVPLHEDHRLKEVKAGRLKDIPPADRERTIAYAYDDASAPGAGFIGGERWVEFEQRVLAAWAALLAGPPWRNLLLVAHDAVNRVLLSHIAGAGLAGLKAFEQDPACVNIIEADIIDGRAERAWLRAVNLCPGDPARLGGHLTVMEKIYRAYQP
jgi:probable phosphoglycerate mutase